MLFYQASAPTGWTQVTTVDDRALRVVGGAGAGTGGTYSFSGYFSGSFSVGSTAITEAQMPSHTHGVNDPSHRHEYASGGVAGGGYNVLSNGNGSNAVTEYAYTGISIQYTGANNGHSHSIPSLQYADVIICTKN
jgi:hypothetical protein